MRVHTLTSEPFSVNVFAVDFGDDALVVDASAGVQFAPLAKSLEAALGDPRRASALYLTHVHCDHVGGARQMRDLLDAPVFMHEGEADAVEQGDARATLGAMLGFPQEPCPVTRIREGPLTLAGHEFEVLLTPGHSPAHTCLYHPESRSLFGGDLVFAMGSFGRVDFPGCDPRALVESIERVSKLQVENLYPGHMQPIEGDAQAAIQWSLENARTLL